MKDEAVEDYPTSELGTKFKEICSMGDVFDYVRFVYQKEPDDLAEGGRRWYLETSVKYDEKHFYPFEFECGIHDASLAIDSWGYSPAGIVEMSDFKILD
ncbi:MAG TPA: hypothetical protein DCO86_00825 [Spirochaetaceae bacterium]|nr:hypothetical protein [Spirochaetaceae bacterium]